jgi:hypothetical protein
MLVALLPTLSSKYALECGRVLWQPRVLGWSAGQQRPYVYPMPLLGAYLLTFWMHTLLVCVLVTSHI